MTVRKTFPLISAALLVSALAAGAFAQKITPPLPEPGWAPDGSPVKVHGQLKAGKAGSKGALLDKSGNPVTLRGMSLFWSNSGSGRSYYNDDVIGWLVHDWNVSVVRAAIAAYAEKGGGGADAGYIENPGVTMSYAKAVIEACIRRGIYVIVDWHTHNGTGTISSSNYMGNITPPAGANGASVQTKAKEFFGAIAKDYGSYPNVLFEIYNEPCDDGTSKACQNESWDKVKSYAEDLRATIRQNSQNVIIVGSPKWSSQPNAANSSQVVDPGSNIAYTFHFYAGGHSSSGGVAPNEASGGNMTSAVNAGLPVFGTEWGTTGPSGDNSYSESSSSDWITLMENNNVGWANWSLAHGTRTTGAGNADSDALTASGGSGPPWSLSASGRYVRGKIQAYNTSSKYPIFGKSSYSVNITQPAEGGAITKSSGSTNFGDSVIITATPTDATWELTRWTGDAVALSANPIRTRISGIDLNISGEFYQGGLIRNGHFTKSAVTSWTLMETNNGAATPDFDSEKGESKITVTALGTVRFQQSASLAAGRKYRLSFEARTGSDTRNMTVNVGSLATTTAALTTVKKQFQLEFSTSAAGSQSVQFVLGDQLGAVIFDNIKMLDIGAGDNTGITVLPPVTVQRTVWSVARTNGGLTLRGPAEAGAKVTLYDVRGKAVRSAAAKDGMTLSAGIPAGNYFLVVKNGAGKEVLRDKVSLVR